MTYTSSRNKHSTFHERLLEMNAMVEAILAEKIAGEPRPPFNLRFHLDLDPMLDLELFKNPCTLMQDPLLWIWNYWNENCSI
jgi:hypothetical protein